MKVEGGQYLVEVEGGQCLVEVEGSQYLVEVEGGQYLVEVKEIKPICYVDLLELLDKYIVPCFMS